MFKAADELELVLEASTFCSVVSETGLQVNSSLCFLQEVDLELTVVMASGDTTILTWTRRSRLCDCPSC